MGGGGGVGEGGLRSHKSKLLKYLCYCYDQHVPFLTLISLLEHCPICILLCYSHTHFKDILPVDPDDTGIGWPSKLHELLAEKTKVHSFLIHSKKTKTKKLVELTDSSLS